MNNKPLISVIVPIYKVEQYMDQCVSSIVNQTYENLEIILVDDGSPDTCPQKCDEWANRDKRIHVIHKKNGGLSDARNYGLDNAQGEYIAFVDSDDYIDVNMYSRLYNGMLKHKSDIEACLIFSDTNGIVKEYNEEGNLYKRNCSVMTGERYIECFLSGVMENASWNKLYKSECFKDRRFKVGRNNEDFLMLYDLCFGIKRIGFIDFFGYYYRQREGSIIHDSSKFLYFDVIENLKEIKRDVYKNHKSLIEVIDSKEIQERIIFMKQLFDRHQVFSYFKEFCTNYVCLWKQPYDYYKQLPINYQRPYLLLRYFPYIYFLKSWLKRSL